MNHFEDANVPLSTQPVAVDRPVTGDERGIIGGVVIASVIGCVAWRTSHGPALLFLIAAFALAHLVSDAAYIIAGRAFGVIPEVVALFAGGWLVRVRVGATTYQIGWFPLTSYVKFPGMSAQSERKLIGKSFVSLHPLARITIILSSAMAMLVMGVVILGVSDAIHILHHAAQVVLSIHGHSASFGTSIRHVISFIGWGNFGRVTGVVMLVMGIVNLLPVPIVSGGAAIFTLAEWLWPSGKGVLRRVQGISLLLSLAAFIAVFLLFVYSMIDSAAKH